MTDPDYMPQVLTVKLAERHEATQHIGRFFVYDHLRGHLRKIARLHAVLFLDLLDTLPDGPEFTVGARKLVEAKDCMVRQALIHSPQDSR